MKDTSLKGMLPIIEYRESCHFFKKELFQVLSNFLSNNKNEKNNLDFTYLFVFRLSQNIFFYNKIGIDFIFLINFFIGNYFTSLEGEKKKLLIALGKKVHSAFSV